MVNLTYGPVRDVPVRLIGDCWSGSGAVPRALVEGSGPEGIPVSAHQPPHLRGEGWFDGVVVDMGPGIGPQFFATRLVKSIE